MKKLILAAVFVGLAEVVPAQAQMDWLTPHLESQRWNNNRRKFRTRKSTRQTRNRKVVVRHPQVQINGQPLRSSAPAVEVNGRTFVPFRDIFEALGATVSYDAKDRLITAKRGTSTMQLSLPGGSTTNRKGNKETFNRGEMPFIRRGVTMVPLRMVSEKMGARVNYVQRSKVPLISITAKTA